MGAGGRVANAEARRPDIDGLRGLTMAAVVAFHAWPNAVPGGFVGVDVFFVLSGFLITGLLLKELDRGPRARLDLPRFYGRRMRRLLPASALVVLTTLLAGVTLGPVGQRASLALDALFAALFAANLRFAVVANDYFNDDMPSPLLHTWSLGVEEQFYLLWPVLLWALCALSRRRRGAIGAGVALVVVVSAVGAVWLTEIDRPWAFFGAPLRAWQLGAGALLAIFNVALCGAVASSAGLIGVALLAYSVFTLGGDRPYPGLWAFLPVLGTVLVIAAGPTSWSGRVFALPTLRVAGNLSYSWYLWHWPVLRFIASWRDEAPSALEMGLGVLLSGVLAAFTYRFVENPLRYATKLQPSRRGLALGAGLTALGVAVALTSWGAVRPRGPRGVLVPEQVARGSSRWRIVEGLELDMVTGARTVPPRLTPDPLLAAADNADAWVSTCVTDRRHARVLDCVLGAKNAPRILALVGDSHAAQWLAALDLVGKSEGWRVVPLIKSACPIGDVPVWNRNVGGPFPQCDVWRRRVERRLAALRPELIVVATRADYYRLDVDGEPRAPEDSAERVRSSFVRTVRRWQLLGERVLFLADTPAPGFKVPRCLLEHDGPDGCAFAPSRRGPLYEGNEPWLRALAAIGVETLDLGAVVCPDPARCPAVADNVVVYRDDDHLTATYATTLAPQLARALSSPAPPVSAPP